MGSVVSWTFRRLDHLGLAVKGLVLVVVVGEEEEEEEEFFYLDLHELHFLSGSCQFSFHRFSSPFNKYVRFFFHLIPQGIVVVGYP